MHTGWLVRRADYVINSSEEDVTQRVMDITGAEHARAQPE